MCGSDINLIIKHYVFDIITVLCHVDFKISRTNNIENIGITTLSLLSFIKVRIIDVTSRISVKPTY